jgi:hypothetical protein
MKKIEIENNINKMHVTVHFGIQFLLEIKLSKKKLQFDKTHSKSLQF